MTAPSTQHLEREDVQQALQGVLLHLQAPDVMNVLHTSPAWRKIILASPPGPWQRLVRENFQPDHEVRHCKAEEQRAQFLDWYSLHRRYSLSPGPFEVQEA